MLISSCSAQVSTSFLDISLYTQKVLRECRTVYFLHDLPTLERYLHEITLRAVNLAPIYYLDGRNRTDIYEDIVRRDRRCQAREPGRIPHAWASVSVLDHLATPSRGMQ
jgi:hypothetical protein